MGPVVSSIRLPVAVDVRLEGTELSVRRGDISGEHVSDLVLVEALWAVEEDLKIGEGIQVLQQIRQVWASGCSSSTTSLTVTVLVFTEVCSAVQGISGIGKTEGVSG